MADRLGAVLDSPDDQAEPVKILGTEPIDYRSYAEAEAARQGVDPDLVHRIIQRESNYDPTAKSPKGAVGLMQLMPSTAKDQGVDPTHPLQNIRGGVSYLRSLIERYKGDTRKAAAAYNSGPEAVDKYGDVPPFKETQDYVKAVVGDQGVQILGSEAIPEEQPVQILGSEDLPEKPPPSSVHAMPRTLAYQLEREKALRGGVAAPTEQGKNYAPPMQAQGMTQPESVKVTQANGLITPGNIDVTKQPTVKNPDGSVSTVDTISVGNDQGEVLIPRVTPDGRHLTSAEAIAEYKKTGRHLGIFDTPEHADTYAQQLHESEAARIAPTQPQGGQRIFTRGRFTGLPGAPAGPPSTIPEPLSEGVIQGGKGLYELVQAKDRDSALNAGSDILEGAMKVGTPLVIAGAIADLPGTLLGVSTAYLASVAAGKAADLSGASPALQRFLGNVAGLATGLGGAKVVYDRLAAAGEAAVSGAKAAARPLVLAGKLSGYGPSEPYPGYRVEPVAAEATVRAGETAPPASAVALEEAIRAESDRAAAESQARAAEQPPITEEQRIAREEMAAPVKILDVAPIPVSEPTVPLAPTPEQQTVAVLQGRQEASTAPLPPVEAQPPEVPSTGLPAEIISVEPIPAGEEAHGTPEQVPAEAPRGGVPASPEGAEAVGGGAPSARPRGVSKAAQRQTGLVDDLVGEAVANGYTGDEAALKTALNDRAAVVKEINQSLELHGATPNALLRAIVKGGGISRIEEGKGGDRGEINWLKQSDLTKRSGFFRDRGGMSLDGTVEYLRQDPRFQHIETINDLVDELTAIASGARKGPGELDRKAVGAVGERWWDRLVPPTADVLPTGEEQARLPEAGAVREQEQPTPEFDMPFSLESEIDKGAREFEQDLFTLREGRQPGEEPEFSRVEKGKPAGMTESEAQRMLNEHRSERPSFVRNDHRYTIRNDGKVEIESAVGKSGQRWRFESVSDDPYAWNYDVTKEVASRFPDSEAARMVDRVNARRTTKDEPQFSQVNAPVFYSSLTRAAEQLPQAKGTSEQMAAMLQKGKGVKKEELDFSGVLPWLKEQSGPVTKQQIADYLKANELQVSEVVAGGALTVKRTGTDSWRVYDQQGNAIDQFSREDEARAVAEKGTVPTKFSQYTLPGGENYRELLITLPAIQDPFDPAQLVITRKQISTTQGSYDLTYKGRPLAQGYDLARAAGVYTGSSGGRFEPLVSNEEIIARAREQYDRTGKIHGLTVDTGAKDFRGGHFETPNVLAHIRMDDRVDAEGKRVLFVEEVQSDWHQKGRREGYRQAAAEVDAVERRRLTDDALAKARAVGVELQKVGDLGYDNRVSAMGSIFGDVRRRVRGGDPIEAAIDRTLGGYDLTAAGTPATLEPAIREWLRAEIASQDAIEASGNKHLVPGAPFKTTWPELAMKRAVRYAAEHGYDKLAWTTGEQQAERYDLSKQVDEIRVYRGQSAAGTVPNQFKVIAYKDGEKLIDRGGLDANGLVENVGKELAEKALGVLIGRAETPYAKFEGDGLKIGGEGMKGFYDKILPAYMGKFGKAFGASVGTTTVNASKAERGPFVKQPVSVHAIDVTPPMREAALQGLPLFQRQNEMLTALGGGHPEVLKAARAQFKDLKQAYETIPKQQIGDRRIVPFYDVGRRLTAAEVKTLLANKGFQAVVNAVSDVALSTLDTLVPKETRAAESVGVLLDSESYGVFFPDPVSRYEGRRRAVILINPLEGLRHGRETPALIAAHTFSTIVHEVTHEQVAGHGADFKTAYANNLAKLGVPARIAAHHHLEAAYADPTDPTRIRTDLTDALSLYSASRGRQGITDDALSGAQSVSRRPTNERGGPQRPAEDARRNRGRVAPRIVTIAELRRLAKARNTTLETERSRAIAAGFQVGQPVRSERGQSATLQSTIVPGAAELGEHVIEPATRAAIAGFQKDRHLLRTIWTPATVSPEAIRAATGTLRPNISRKDQIIGSFRRNHEAVAKAMDSWSHDESLAFWDVMQGLQPASSIPAEWRPVAETFREILNHWTHEVTSRDLIRSYLENYWPQEWAKPEAAANLWQRIMGRRPLAGRESFRKHRTIPNTRTGVEEYGLTPFTWNPARQLDRKITEMARSVEAYDIRAGFREQGFRKWIAVGKKPPQGWEKDVDRGPVYGPSTFKSATGEDVRIPFGRLVAGNYYLQPDVARLLKNHLSPGLWGKSAVFDAYRVLGNLTSQTLLGWSTFHMWLTGLEDIISKQTLVTELLQNGEIAAATKAQSQVGPQGLVRDLVRGYKAVNRFYKDNPAADDLTSETGRIINAGGGFDWSEFEHENAPAKFMQDLRGLTGALKRFDVAETARLGARAAMHAPLAAIELPTNLIMTHWVPYLKASAFLDLAEAEMKRLGPDASLEDQRRALAGAWDAVEDRLGQLRRDNLFWNKSFEQILTGAFLSVTWNVGSLRAGAMAIPGQVRRIAEHAAPGGPPGTPPPPVGMRYMGVGPKGLPVWAKQDPWIHRRMLWLFVGAVIVGMIDAVYQYLHTGKPPQSLKDLYAPCAELDEHGNCQRRVVAISYAKDYYSWATHPVTTLGHKLKPFLGMLWDAWTNQDFYGNALRDPNDPVLEQIGEVLSFWLSQERPIAWQNAKRIAGPDASTSQILRAWAGMQAAPFTPAAAAVERDALGDYLHSLAPQIPKTTEEAKRAEARRELAAALKAHDAGKARAAIAAGGLSGRSVQTVVRNQRLTSIQRSFEYATLPQAVKAYEIATPEERAEIRPIFTKKANSLFGSIPAPDRAAMRQRINAALALPTASPRAVAAQP